MATAPKKTSAKKEAAAAKATPPAATPAAEPPSPAQESDKLAQAQKSNLEGARTRGEVAPAGTGSLAAGELYTEDAPDKLTRHRVSLVDTSAKPAAD